jgi:hypothetical protein
MDIRFYRVRFRRICLQNAAQQRIVNHAAR